MYRMLLHKLAGSHHQPLPSFNSSQLVYIGKTKEELMNMLYFIFSQNGNLDN
jgi:hypothetical protein